MKKTFKNHINQDLLFSKRSPNELPISEAHFLRESIAMCTKIDWRQFSKKENLADKKTDLSIREFKKLCNKNFNNETVVRYRAY